MSLTSYQTAPPSDKFFSLNFVSLQLLKELSKSVKQVIFEGLSDTGSIQAIFDESICDEFKKVLANLILEQLPKLKKFIVDNQSNIFES